MKNTNWTTFILWAVYLGLLLVLLPHTAWLFMQFEPVDAVSIFGLLDLKIGGLTAWAGAFAFEAAIAALTHKLARHMEQKKRFARGPVILNREWSGWPKFSYRYLNAYSYGLVAAIAVSALANLAHSVEYGRTLAIFAQWGIPAKVYQLAFGGVLPVVSLIFARVLSNVTETDDVPNPELDKANKTIGELRQQWKAAEGRAKDAEHWAKAAEGRANEAETKFGAIAELFARLFAEDKRQRIITVKTTWPKLPNSAIAAIAESSPSYVSEVLASAEDLQAIDIGELVTVAPNGRDK